MSHMTEIIPGGALWAAVFLRAAGSSTSQGMVCAVSSFRANHVHLDGDESDYY